MSNNTNGRVVAKNACPYCRGTIPDRTDEDYKLASCSMEGTWSEEFGRRRTGYWFCEHCPHCGELITGVEYEPQLISVEFLPGQPNELVFGRWVAWYSLVKGGKAEPVAAPDPDM